MAKQLGFLCSFPTKFEVSRVSRTNHCCIVACHKPTPTTAYPRGKATHARRVFVGEAQLELGARIVLSDTEAAHLRASRARRGAKVTLLNSQGHAAPGVLGSSRNEVTVTGAVSSPSNGQRISLGVALCAPRSPSRADWAVEKLAELGVTRTSLVGGAERMQQGDVRSRLNRWQRVVAASCKQSLAPSVMKVDALPGALDDAVRVHTDASCVLLCSPDGAPLLAVATRLDLSYPLLLVGPEGGLTLDEERRLVELGAVLVSLGRTRLRVETAAVSACATVVALRSALETNESSIRQPSSAP